jgi:hypothetical protein
MIDRHLLTHSLVKLNNENQPVGSASGCVVKYSDNLFLLSVWHATGAGNWTLLIEYDESRKAMKLKPLDMTFMKLLKVANGVIADCRDVDFSVQLLSEPPNAMHQEIREDGVVLSSLPKRIIPTTLDGRPDPKSTYGFWGGEYDAFEPGKFYLIQHLEENLRWTDEDEDMLFFERSEPYRSYADYKGCSGAPITDEKGNLVAVLVGGDEDNSGFWGLSVAKYRSVLAVEIMESQRQDNPPR